MVSLPFYYVGISMWGLCDLLDPSSLLFHFLEFPEECLQMDLNFPLWKVPYLGKLQGIRLDELKGERGQADFACLG